MLPDCLASLAFANERLVLVDAATVDRTREVARMHGARVEERLFDTFAQQRDAALELAHGEWVLFVDADERVPAALRSEVLATIREEPVWGGFWIPRDIYLMGHLIRYAGWYPDYQLRLVRKGKAHFDPQRPVHEVALIDGLIGHLREPLVHLNYRNLSEFIRKQEHYCGFEADRWLATYGPPRRRAIVGQPLREFWRRYIGLQGYREGPIGLLLCLLLAYYAG